MLESVLYYSYNPACHRAGLSQAIRDAVTRTTPSGGEDSLISTGKQTLRQVFDQELQEIGTGGTHIVPLSGGLDSRTILASLLAHPSIDSRQIQTVSFGTPGTWDYELGQQVASKARVSNTALNLTADSFDWSVEALRRYAETRDCPTRMFEGYVNAAAIARFDDGSTVWSGFLGDPSVGAHQPAEPATKWNTARKRFVEANRATESLVPPQFQPTASLPPEPYIPRTQLSYEEQLDFAHRQQCFIAPLVLYESDRYATPFARQEWLTFSLNLPRQHRQNRALFTRIVQQRFPELFSVPTDANNGLPLDASPRREFVRSVRRRLQKKALRALGRYTSRNTNYVNFARQFRQGGQLAATAKTLLGAFDQREIASWLDAEELWNRHQSGADLAAEIRILCSLELFYTTRRNHQ